MCLAVLLCLVPGAHAAETADTAPAADVPVEIEVFKGPTADKFGRLSYPEVEYAEGREGWVQLHMMIDPTGKPYEVSVIDSSGIDLFERAAVQSIKNSTFHPAMLGNQPVDAGLIYKFVFTLREPSKGASKQFAKAYKQLLQAIDAGDRTTADAKLAKLQINNLYENAYSNVARFQYYRKWGTEAQQLAALRRAVAGEPLPRYLPDEVFTEIVRSLLTLQLRTKDFASALKTWETLQKSAPKESLAKLEPIIARVEALRTADSPYSIEGEIDKETSWFYTLFKNRFQIDVASGRLAEIKLRCDKQYVFFRYEPGVQYRISDKYGSCGLELVGDHGTKFSLVQS
jgi:TonB family protein